MKMDAFLTLALLFLAILFALSQKGSLRYGATLGFNPISAAGSTVTFTSIAPGFVRLHSNQFAQSILIDLSIVFEAGYNCYKHQYLDPFTTLMPGLGLVSTPLSGMEYAGRKPWGAHFRLPFRKCARVQIRGSWINPPKKGLIESTN